ncbi:unnamed protein product [Urochloa humidicola]
MEAPASVVQNYSSSSAGCSAATLQDARVADGLPLHEHHGEDVEQPADNDSAATTHCCFGSALIMTGSRGLASWPPAVWLQAGIFLNSGVPSRHPCFQFDCFVCLRL